MASRVMHLAIAAEIVKQIPIKDVNRFRLGVILPDAYNRNVQTANNSHLKYTTADGTKKTYNLGWFRKTYAEQLKNDDLYLGYYLHLIQDMIFRYFVYSLHNWDPYPKGNTERLHNDYRLLNNYVIDRYKLPDSLVISDRIKEESIFNIYPFGIEQLSVDFKTDFEPYNNGSAFFFTEEMTDEFIKIATEKCVTEINALNHGKSAIDELEWAWDNNPQRSKSTTEGNIMDKSKAIKYISENARPLELAVYRYFFEGGSNQAVIDELSEFQNVDGGFGHALEPDFFNPNSSPIATNDAIITLSRVNALDRDSDIVKGIVSYLNSHDFFNEDKKRWLFAIDSNKDYPHAIWWEKKGDGISKFNPSISLAAFMVCYGNRTPLYEEIIKEAAIYLKNGEISGDDVNCYLLAYELLISNNINDIVDLNAFKDLLSKAIESCICKDISKYGVEYVPMPSVIFTGRYLEFITTEIKPLIAAEKDILAKHQMEDGGFDITWKWYTPYPDEYEQARAWWRPRITIEKLLFNEIQI